MTEFGVYALAGFVMLAKTLLEVRADTAVGASITAASVVPVCLGLIVCVVCFQRAFRKP